MQKYKNTKILKIKNNYKYKSTKRDICKNTKIKNTNMRRRCAPNFTYDIMNGHYLLL